MGELGERSRMDQRHRVPNLEEMDEQETRHFLIEQARVRGRRGFTKRDWSWDGGWASNIPSCLA
jgi:hypothetical protein